MDAPMGDAATLRSMPPLAWDAPPSDASSAKARADHWPRLLKAEGIACEFTSVGQAAFVVASVEPTTGDPDLLSVSAATETGSWWVDRRTMRAQRTPETAHVAETDVVRAADLGDRVQLALGEPVLVRIGLRGARFVVEGVQLLNLHSAFTRASYRRLAPLIAGASTLAPLAIDAIDRALRLEAEGEEPRVRRLYGRAYRRMDEHHTPFTGRYAKATRQALHRRLRLGRDVALGLRDAREFHTELLQAGSGAFAPDFGAMHTTDLIASLHRNMTTVVRALALLERARLATLSLLPAIEMTAGSTPRATFEALAALSFPRTRQSVDGRLLDMAEHCSWLNGRLGLPGSGHAADWAKLRLALKQVRMLGMDVRPDAMGASDTSLLQAIEEVVARQPATREAERREAERTLLSRALRGPFGPVAVPVVMGQLFLLRQLAEAKGQVAEDLSLALLRLRSVAIGAGTRLSEQGLLDQADDAFYMPLDEIEQALSGELGAYGARVRLRREDDRRFRSFDAPRRIAGRASLDAHTGHCSSGARSAGDGGGG